MRRFLRKVHLLFDLVAQLVEQYTFNVWALGSSPSQITKPKGSAKCGAFFCKNYLTFFLWLTATSFIQKKFLSFTLALVLI